MILKDCHSGIVKYEDKDYRVRVVSGIDNNPALYFKDDKLQDVRMKDVHVIFNDNIKGCIKARCEVIVHKNPGYPRMQEYWMGECEIIEVIEIIQRQQDIRASVDLSVQFTSETESRAPFFGTITNISAGGIYMVTSQALTIGEELSFHYSFKNTERPFRVMVLWGKLDESGENGYGLRFVNLTEGGETAIRGYVFNVLREQRSKSREGM